DYYCAVWENNLSRPLF
nr:immunoglobulin light chain junction region [Macaca mulatta]MOX72327.1 immunoglobulin light chain junction region [Macaca mulatta]